jgi:glycosyltransferase involved in cell wall biosynthesis
VKVLSVVVGIAARAGGTAAFVGEGAMELGRLGEMVTILSTDLALAPTGWIQRQRRITAAERHPSLANAGVRVFRAQFPRRLAFSPGLSRAANELAAQSDVVHVHNLWQFPQYAGYRAAVRSDVPYVVSPHGALDPYLRRHGRVRKRLSSLLYQDELLRRAALIHVTTEAEAELIADVAPEVPRAIVPCGTYVEQFRELPARERFRRTHLRGYDGPLVLFLGRLTYKKGLDVLVRAFARARRAQECRLVVAGPDDEGLTPALRAVARTAGAAEEVEFVGPLYGEDRLAALASADVWALSSFAENFGIAVVEAMAAGCPVVISRGVNLAGEVEAAKAGVVSEPTPEAFGDAIFELLSDDARRRRLSATARAFAARYDWSVVAPRLAEMYQQAASSAGAARAATCSHSSDCSTRARPAAPSSRASSSSASTRSRAAASDSGSSGATSKPARPWSRISGIA